ncbi:molybdopterin-binding protein [Salana multivorans]|uniref:Molybdopterin-binding protein n=1 Tax=Salana multivorans TaxID=120377 RepID=A0A3N2D9L8_9MICO|nr:TOBE domain-containing protein [Salana multivorans]OJX95464.1 MAG: MerR family transcriptional regulator [Micrococcales bacterium 73-15]ROR96481.1 molybdopterin-binding protein [Salana multivorans]
MSVRRLRIAEAAALLGVSTDTVRRRLAERDIETSPDAAGVATIAGEEVARLAEEEASDSHLADLGPLAPASVRNRLRGIVTRVLRDGVMAQVEVQAGPYRLVSLISREAADELELAPGSLVAATVKATNLGIEGIG